MAGFGQVCMLLNNLQSRVATSMLPAGSAVWPMLSPKSGISVERSYLAGAETTPRTILTVMVPIPSNVPWCVYIIPRI